MTHNSLSLEPGMLGRLMPLCLALDARAQITSAGPVAQRIFPSLQPGSDFFAHFTVTHPRDVRSAEALRHTGQRRLRLSPTAPPQSALRGLAVPVAGGGVLINLSFGIDLPQAVRRHQLTESDFAATDPAVELLFLIEVNRLVTQELTGLTRRLQGARMAAEARAQSDPLTGLGNRRAADELLAHLSAGSAPFGLLHLDLDHFKQINDSFGHAAGDALLQHVGLALQREARSTDLPARIGGDEFLLLLPGLGEITLLEQIAERITRRLRRPLPWQDHHLIASASMGLLIGRGGEAAEQLLARVDTALYQAKRNGRGQHARAP